MFNYILSCYWDLGRSFIVTQLTCPIHIQASMQCCSSRALHFLALMQILTLKNDRMKSKDPLAPPYHERRIPMTIILTVLCGFSFYLGGIFISMKKLHTMDVSQAVQLPKEVTSASLQVQPIDFPECNSDYQDYTPFTDPKVYFKMHTIKKCTLLQVEERGKNLGTLLFSFFSISFAK